MHFLHYSKRGTTSVFLMMILASILMLAGLFIHASSEAAGRSYADAVFDLAGRSVLSEYDLPLQNRYGIFAVHTDERQAEGKIKYYVDYSFHDNYLKEALRGKDYMDTLNLDLESVHVNLKGYSMTDTVLFEQQILEYMKYGIVVDNLIKEKSFTPVKQKIELRNDQIINGLPSNGYQDSLFNDLKRIAENGIPSLSEIKNKTKDTYLVDEYIIGHFINHQRGHEIRDTFFLNEIEYVLKGNFNDERNYNAVRTDLFIMRNVLNLIHVNSDAEKRKKVEAAAAILTLVKGEEIGAAVVAEAWAAAETENDLRLLEDGKEVALIKNKDNWAVPISLTLEYLWKDDYVKPKQMNGYDYEDYLRILLFLENREKKLLRCMDLIQLNMKSSYNRDFDLKEYYGGFQFEAIARDRKYTYVQKF